MSFTLVLAQRVGYLTGSHRKPFIFFGGGRLLAKWLAPKKVGEKLIMISLHSDVVNLVSQCDLLGWLCCQECLRWSAGGCGITYVVEATWSQSQGDGHLHRLRMADGWTDGTVCTSLTKGSKFQTYTYTKSLKYAYSWWLLMRVLETESKIN